MTELSPANQRVHLCAFAIALMAMATACGDDGDGGGGQTAAPTPAATATPEEARYFTDLEASLAALDAEALLLDAEREEAFNPARPEEERLAASAGYGAEYELHLARRRDTVSAVQPPESLVPLHDALLKAAADAVAMAQAVNTALAAAPVSTSEEFASLIEQADGPAVAEHYRDACVELQSRARALAVQVDLSCG